METYAWISISLLLVVVTAYATRGVTRRAWDRSASIAALTGSTIMHVTHSSENIPFDKVFEESAIGMTIVGMDGSFLRVNPALERILGLTAARLEHMTFQEITHPDDLAADLALLKQLHAGAIPRYSFEKRYVVEGRTIEVHLGVSLIRDPSTNEPLYCVCQIQDVTAANQNLRLLKEMFEKEQRRGELLHLELEKMREDRLAAQDEGLSKTAARFEAAIKRIEQSIKAQERDSG